MKKKLYLLNGFVGIIRNLKKLLPYAIVEFFPKSHRLDMITDFWRYFRDQLMGKMKKYDVIHINTWENFLNAKKRKGQVLIGESHGFHFGLNFKDTLKHFKGIKWIVAHFIEFSLGSRIRKKIKEFDIYYVSTPNMIQHAKKIRTDAKRLPNAINTDIFTPEGNKAELRGNPVIFFPTRLHSFKKPEKGIELFDKIKSKYNDAVLHLIKYPSGCDPLASYYEKKFIDKNTYVWHNFKKPEELAEMYRGSDIILGQFHEDLGMMSLVELEATACGVAVISYDKYEIKTELDNLENILFSILEDKNKYKEYVATNLAIVLNNHSPEKVSKRLLDDIEIIKNEIEIKPLSKQLIKDHIIELQNIDQQRLAEIGVRGLDNFLYELHNKFEVSFCIFSGGKLAGYIIGYSTNEYGYINRIAVGNEFSGKGFGKKLLDHFTDNLKYNYDVNKIELVTHAQLNVDGFYIKNGYTEITNNGEIDNFLKRKDRLNFIEEYTGKNKKMLIFHKNI